jgi:hypothetical protein
MAEGRFDAGNARHRRALLDDDDIDGLPPDLLWMIAPYRRAQQAGVRGDASALAQRFEAAVRGREGA